jgi:hypothetical protein
MSKCPFCLQELSTGGCGCGPFNNRINFQTRGTPTAPHKFGWECPKCGTVYAPWVPECRKCPSMKAASGA